jgi:hypothetical protein
MKILAEGFFFIALLAALAYGFHNEIVVKNASKGGRSNVRNVASFLVNKKQGQDRLQYRNISSVKSPAKSETIVK